MISGCGNGNILVEENLLKELLNVIIIESKLQLMST